MTNKLQGNYPVKLPEMHAVISTLSQFKRVMDNQDSYVADDNNIADFGMRGFFDDFGDGLTATAPVSLAALPPAMKVTSGATPPKTKDDGMNTVAVAETLEQSPKAQTDSVNFNKPAAVTSKPEAVEKTVPDFFDMPMSTKKTADRGVIFRAYDIRGIVGKTLTKEVVYDIGRALGTQAKELGCKTIVVGRDGRTSSPALAEALAKGIITTGSMSWI